MATTSDFRPLLVGARLKLDSSSSRVSLSRFLNALNAALSCSAVGGVGSGGAMTSSGDEGRGQIARGPVPRPPYTTGRTRGKGFLSFPQGRGPPPREMQPRPRCAPSGRGDRYLS